MSFAGKYDLVSSDKFDEYLKAIGIGMINRTIVNKTKPTLEFINGGNNKWTMKTLTTMKNLEINYTLGEEFDEKTADDRIVKTTVTLEGYKLIQKRKGETGPVIITYDFNGNDLTVSYAAKDVVATRVYKKV